MRDSTAAARTRRVRAPRERGTLARWRQNALRIFSQGRESRYQNGKQPGVVFLDACGSLEDLCVVVGREADGPPVLLGLSGGRWLRPFPLPRAAIVNALCQVDDERWLVVGRETNGRGFVVLYSPLDWSVEPLPGPETRAFLACASRRERDVSLAVGADGTIVRFEHGVSSTTQLDGGPIWCAPPSTCWIANGSRAFGGMWASAGGANWKRVWHDANWKRPFVSIHADVASVMAMTADGAVFECRASLPSAEHA